MYAQEPDVIRTRRVTAVAGADVAEGEMSAILTNERSRARLPTGTSKVIRDVIHLIRQVAGHDSTVLILGETGTGKSLFADESKDTATIESAAKRTADEIATQLQVKFNEQGWI